MYFSIGTPKGSTNSMWYPGPIIGAIRSLLYHSWASLPQNHQDPNALKLRVLGVLESAFSGFRDAINSGTNVFDEPEHLLLKKGRYPDNVSTQEFIERAIKEAIWSCAIRLPIESRNIDVVESHVRRLIDRELSNFEADWTTFQG